MNIVGTGGQDALHHEGIVFIKRNGITHHRYKMACGHVFAVNCDRSTFDGDIAEGGAVIRVTGGNGSILWGMLIKRITRAL